MLNVWTRGEGVAKTAGQVYLDVMCDGDLVHSVDTALDMSVVLANISLRSVPDNISFVARPCKTSDSSTLRISYVFGVQLISASGQNLLDPPDPPRVISLIYIILTHINILVNSCARQKNTKTATGVQLGGAKALR
eukprot:COSAG01_NODE_32854_length_574_cov_0.810526_1_plen_136_part_00